VFDSIMGGEFYPMEIALNTLKAVAYAIADPSNAVYFNNDCINFLQ